MVQWQSSRRTDHESVYFGNDRIDIIQQSEYEKLVEHRDLDGLYKFLLNGSFSAKSDAWLDGDAKRKAVHVMDLIRAVDKIMPGVMSCYDTMSERVHPNSLGHRGFFASLDRNSGATAFCFRKISDKNGFLPILAVYGSTPLAERWLNEINELVPMIADLQSPR
ncbi:hypothetical protein [Methylobacterium iners]|uniref:hypothetical protein n=1 Tax=Methylobacterium iners TaxID=418707 RepID=UPI001EE32B71|nr:hypothetical protein [Methylobacterium iners]